LVIVAWFLSSICYADFRLAVINDPDGYTNVRKAPDPKSDVLFKVTKNEFFLCETGKGSWWKAKDFFQNTGFIHKNRVRFYQDLSGKEKEPGYWAWALSLTDGFEDMETHWIDDQTIPSYGSWTFNRDLGQLYQESIECDGAHHREVLFYFQDPPEAVIKEITGDLEAMKKAIPKVVKKIPTSNRVFKTRRGITLGQGPEVSIRVFGKPHLREEQGDLEILQWQWSYASEISANFEWLEKAPSFWRTAGARQTQEKASYSVKLFYRKEKLIGLVYYWSSGGC
jgi:hypothetical protein